MVTRKTASLILGAAAIYNLLWGAWVVLFPLALFDWAGLPKPTYPGIWQCVGMIVGVYGVGYWIAASDPVRHWPVVLVGFLGKIFGPIGFVQAYYEGVFNLKFGMTIVFNDLLWWYPFAAILYLAFKENTRINFSAKEKTMEQILFADGRSLKERSQSEALVVVLVRHSGCTFCREALARLRANLDEIQGRNLVPIVVHMGTEESGSQLAQTFSLQDVEFVSDPKLEWYQFFGARKGSLQELFGPRVWLRGFVDGVVKRRGLGRLQGDGFQMGGVYLVQQGVFEILHSPKDAADVEDWQELLQDKKWPKVV